MKKICGFIGLNGIFYKEEKDCKNANDVYKIEKIKNKLDMFYENIDSYMFFNSNNNVSEEYHYIKEDIFKTISKKILKNKDMFLEVINEAETLKEELNILEKTYKNDYLKPWWLKIKWWL